MIVLHYHNHNCWQGELNQLFCAVAEVEAVSDDEGGRQAAGGAHHSQHRGGRDAGMAEAEPEAPQPQGPSANKSVAEMLRAKLKVSDS
jgi:hypothetical protein